MHKISRPALAGVPNANGNGVGGCFSPYVALIRQNLKKDALKLKAYVVELTRYSSTRVKICVRLDLEEDKCFLFFSNSSGLGVEKSGAVERLRWGSQRALAGINRLRWGSECG